MYFSYARFNTNLDFLKDVCLLAVFNVLKYKLKFKLHHLIGNNTQ